jgi:pimeloyl-ACP methyl ester carboxylesterase
MNEINSCDPKNAEDGDIGIIAIEIMPISFRITSPILGRDEMCRQINAILDKHGFHKVVLATHSYGSVITSQLVQNPTTAAKIGPILLVDPVTFLLHLPDVCYNFTAREPRRANEHQLHFFACTDMMVSHTLARNFFWAQNILWKEDLKDRDVTVSLGGKDLLVDAETVGKYIAGVDLRSEDKSWKDRELTGSGIEPLMWDTCDHAQVFERAEGRRVLGDVIRRYVEKTDVEDDELP